MGRWHTVYKVIANRNEFQGPTRKLSSNTTPNFSLEYVISDITIPTVKNSLIFAFDTLEAAVEFFDFLDLPIVEILYCEGEEPLPLDMVSDGFHIEEFWKCFDDIETENPYAITPTPRGTVGCRSIIPHRIVTKEEIEEARRVAV